MLRCLKETRLCADCAGVSDHSGAHPQAAHVVDCRGTPLTPQTFAFGYVLEHLAFMRSERPCVRVDADGWPVCGCGCGRRLPRFSMDGVDQVYVDGCGFAFLAGHVPEVIASFQKRM